MTRFVHPTISVSGSSASATRAVRPLIICFLVLVHMGNTKCAKWKRQGADVVRSSP